MEPFLGGHAEPVAVLGEQVVVGAGLRAELFVLAQQQEDVREWTSVTSDFLDVKKFSIVGLQMR